MVGWCNYYSNYVNHFMLKHIFNEKYSYICADIDLKRIINEVMKKIAVLMLFLAFVFFVSAQDKEEKTNGLLKELSENACNCIDSVDTYNKIKDQVSADIARCIDEQAGAYQLGAKLMGIDLSGLDSTKNVNILIETNNRSPEYRKYYNEIEGYLMENCDALKQKIASSDLENENSVSHDERAKKFYSKGMKDYESENYKKAIVNFEKAVEIDSMFAFAWDNIGLCQRKLGNYDKAIEAYNKSLTIDPNGIMPLQNLAVTYRYTKEFHKALEAYRRLAEIDVTNAETFYGLGLVYAVDLQDYEQGLDNMCKAYNLYTIQKSPYRSDAEKLISYIYAEMKKQDKLDRFHEIMKSNGINVNIE